MVHSMGNKLEELDICVLSQGYILTAVMKMGWDSLYD